MKNATPSIETFTSAEAGAWSNSYLVAGASEAILFDVPMLRSDARKLADMIFALGKTLRQIMISHAHPDHFMSLDLICDRFPQSEPVSTKNVVTDIETDGPGCFLSFKGKSGPRRPRA